MFEVGRATPNQPAELYPTDVRSYTFRVSFKDTVLFSASLCNTFRLKLHQNWGDGLWSCWSAFLGTFVSFAESNSHFKVTTAVHQNTRWMRPPLSYGLVSGFCTNWPKHCTKYGKSLFICADPTSEIQWKSMWLIIRIILTCLWLKLESAVYQGHIKPFIFSRYFEKVLWFKRCRYWFCENVLAEKTSLAISCSLTLKIKIN